MFTQRDTEQQCCYGASDDCEYLTGKRHLNHSSCIQLGFQERRHSVQMNLREHSHCVLKVKSINKEDDGFYQFFEQQDTRSQVCHILVEASQKNYWKVASLSLIVLLFIAVIFFCMFIITKKAFNVPENCKSELRKTLIL